MAAERLIDSRRELVRLVSGSAFIFFCRAAGAALTFVTQILLARWMGAAELGIYVLVFSWCILLATISTGGFRIASIRFIGEAIASSEPEYITGYVRRSQQITFCVSIGIVIVAVLVVLIGDALGWVRSAPVFLFGFAIVPLFALLNLYSSFANALSRFPLSFIPINIARPLLFLLGIYFYWFAGYALNAEVSMTINLATFVVVTIPTTLIIRHLIAHEVPAVPPKYATRTWVTSAAPLLLVALFTGYFPSLMIVIAGPHLPSNELAVFHVCFRIAMLITFGLIAVDAFTGPQIVQLLNSEKENELRRVVNRITRLRFWAALLAVAALSLAGRWVLALFGDEFVAGYPILMILAFAQLVQAGAGPVTRLLSLSGHQNRSIKIFATSTVIALILVTILAQIFGVTGVALATVLVTVTWVAWTRHVVDRTLDIRPSPF